MKLFFKENFIVRTLRKMIRKEILPLILREDVFVLSCMERQIFVGVDMFELDCMSKLNGHFLHLVELFDVVFYFSVQLFKNVFDILQNFLGFKNIFIKLRQIKIYILGFEPPPSRLSIGFALLIKM